MSPALQAKLLRVLQEREFERVGDSHTIKIDVRVIAATHSDLATDGRRRHVPRGSLLPAERDSRCSCRRCASAARTSRCWCSTSCRSSPPKRAAARVTISQDALRRLMAYHWPGNVRQLENVVERALAFSQGRSQIDVQDLAARHPESAPAPSDASEVWFPDDGLDFERYIEGVELSLIRRSLERTQRQQAAGGQAAEPEAHDAHREAEAPRTARPVPQSCHNRRICLRGTITGRSSSTASRPRSAPHDAGRAAADAAAAAGAASGCGDEVVRARTAVGIAGGGTRRRRARAGGRRDGRASSDRRRATGGPAANTRIRAIDSRCRATRSAGGSPKICSATARTVRRRSRKATLRRDRHSARRSVVLLAKAAEESRRGARGQPGGKRPWNRDGARGPKPPWSRDSERGGKPAWKRDGERAARPSSGPAQHPRNEAAVEPGRHARREACLAQRRGSPGSRSSRRGAGGERDRPRGCGGDRDRARGQGPTGSRPAGDRPDSGRKPWSRPPGAPPERRPPGAPPEGRPPGAPTRCRPSGAGSRRDRKHRPARVTAGRPTARPAAGGSEAGSTERAAGKRSACCSGI